MKRIIGFLLLSLCLLGAKPASAAIIPLTVDGGWQSFNFRYLNEAWNDVYEFTLTTSAKLTVTDAYLSGDKFEIRNIIAAEVIGETSDPTSLRDQIDGDYDAALADARWSSGSWILDAGHYAVTGITIVSPFQDTYFGTGGLRVDSSAVPEPATLVLFGSGLAGFFVRRRMA